jgi:hypothetical protein
MVADHARLDRQLSLSARKDGSIDEEAYAVFRHDLLRHIAMEGKVLLPFARVRRGGEPLPVATALRADHGAIAQLLVRSPTAGIVNELRELLGRHNALEEGPDGLYATCDALGGGDAELVVARLPRATECAGREVIRRSAARSVMISHLASRIADALATR